MRFLLVCAGILTATCGFAADSKGNFAVSGVGGQSCQAVLERLEANPNGASEVAAWIQGYMTAWNRQQPNTYDVSPVLDAAALTRMTLGVCRTTPAALLESAAAAMVISLSTAKVAENSKLVQLKSGQATIVLRAETIDRLHVALAEQKLMPAKKPGAPFDASTESALRTFQKNQSLPQSGLPDAATLVRILVEMPKMADAAKSQPRR